MSNCVDLHGGNRELVLTEKFFDVKQLRQDIQACPTDYEAIGKEDYKNINIWWFIKFNSWFAKSGTVHITLAAGKSTHTWRDLKWVFWFLGEYLHNADIQPAEVQLKMSDEYDGHKEKFWCSFRFGEQKR